MAVVRVLAGRIGPRPAGSGADRRAERFISRTFAAAGWDTEVDRFGLPHGGTSSNVIATWGPAGRRTVLIGAHRDTVEGAPGGNDNASGVGTILELARVLADTRLAPGVTLVAFGGEERQPDGTHHLGSERYAGQVVAGRRPPVLAMASVDMIGKNAPLIVGWLGDGDPRMVRVVLRSAEGAGVAAAAHDLGDVSDNGPFEMIGVPAALLWTGLEPAYHSPADVVSNVDIAALRRAGNVLIGVIRRLLRG